MKIRHSDVVALVGFIVFFGAATAMLSDKVNCGMGPAKDDETANETQKRSDDQSFFTHVLCASMQAKHNR